LKTVNNKKTKADVVMLWIKTLLFKNYAFYNKSKGKYKNDNRRKKWENWENLKKEKLKK